MSLIKDVIHRFVKLPELCRQFVDTPEFNRLRRIKQLGLAHYVYPSATHTRFEHSIGVMCLAGKVADVLGISGREKELVQLAGLLHDAGHVAFSHLMDYILEEKKINPEISHHEFRSIYILKRINSRIQALNEREVGMVSKMILGDSSGEEKPYLFEIINNKVYGLDVDRLDYLQRDMYHTGMPCFQADYILECLKIKNNHLAVQRKARVEIEMMYEARKRLLTLVCRHKTVMKAEKIIRKAIEKLSITEEWFTHNWLKLDDGRMHCMMEEQCPELVRDLDIRNWHEINPDSRFEHISHITREDIDKQMDKVIWYE